MTYAACPKCGHAPLPAQQASPAACQLIGGGTGAEKDGHDWQNIFGDLGLLRSARGIGNVFGRVGEAMMLAGLAWAAWMVWLQKAKLSDSPFAKERRE